MCWQAVKGAAIEHGVPDWTSKVDPSLTYEENIRLMKQYSTTKGYSMKYAPFDVHEKRLRRHY